MTTTRTKTKSDRLLYSSIFGSTQVGVVLQTLYLFYFNDISANFILDKRKANEENRNRSNRVMVPIKTKKKGEKKNSENVPRALN